MARAVAARATARTRLPRAVRMREILQTASTVFCERGFEDTAVGEIARRLGVVEGTIYKYFGSKRELLQKTLAYWHDELFVDFSRELAAVSGARNRLHYVIWRHLCTVRDYPRVCGLIFSEGRSRADYRNSELHRLNRRYSSLLTGVVDEGIRSGEFHASASPALIRDLIFGGVEHYAWRHLHGHGSLDVDTLAAQLIATLSAGLLAKPLTTSPPEDTLQQQLDRLSAVADRLEGLMVGVAISNEGLERASRHLR